MNGIIKEILDDLKAQKKERDLPDHISGVVNYLLLPFNEFSTLAYRNKYEKENNRELMREAAVCIAAAAIRIIETLKSSNEKGITEPAPNSPLRSDRELREDLSLDETKPVTEGSGRIDVSLDSTKQDSSTGISDSENEREGSTTATI